MMVAALPKILVTDDNKQLVKLLSIKLSLLGYDIDTALSADEGFTKALNNSYDLIILDVMMPKRSGLEVCRELRMRGVLTPVLILSGKTDKISIVECLEAGADDYLTKPFSHQELVARIHALLRRDKKTFESLFINRDKIELDTTKQTIKFDNNEVQLTKTETELLRRLMYAAPKAVSRKALLEDVWGIDYRYSSNRLEVYIGRLRDKLKELSGHSYIQTNRGQGYHFGK